MTAMFSEPLSLPRRSQPGDSSVASLPLNDSRECGRGRVALSAVILAQRGSPGQGLGSTSPWTRKPKPSVIQRGAPAPRGIPRSGAGQYVAGTSAEPSRGIPARSARMTAENVDAEGSPSPPSSSRRFPRLGREPSEAVRGRKGGARERAKLSPQGGSGAERTLRRRNPPKWFHHGNDTILKSCCHSRAPRGNPPVGSTMVATTYCPAPASGIPRPAASE